MRYLWIIGILFVLGCEGTFTPTIDESKFKIRVIDGCEYIEYHQGCFNARVYAFTHKGNCKNPIHQETR